MITSVSKSLCETGGVKNDGISQASHSAPLADRLSCILTLPRRLLFLLEVFEVLYIVLMLWRFLVLCQFLPILVLGMLCFGLEFLPCFFWDALPVFADNLGNLSEGKRLSLQLLSSP